MPRTDPSDRRWRNFRIFNEQGGKFRIGIINTCNLSCFFCHNEAMPNPRVAQSAPLQQHGPEPLPVERLLRIMNTYAAMGGRQINITGGEPLVYPQLAHLSAQIEKHDTRVVLNTNAVLGQRLLSMEKLSTIDGLLASLHTTQESTFHKQLGGSGIGKVMENLVALRDHGYDVVLNFSLGLYNRDDFDGVLKFSRRNRLPLKVIALVRSHEEPSSLQGDWVDPGWIDEKLDSFGAELMSSDTALGGYKSTYNIDGVIVELKNVARGSLRTNYCDGCEMNASCGEGIYGLRVGVDGLWKPCLLRTDGYRKVEDNRSDEDQILEIIDTMIGNWSEAQFSQGVPE